MTHNKEAEMQGSNTHSGTGSTHGAPELDEFGAPIECLDGPEGCSGAVEFRMPLSATGRAFPRCDAHWEIRLDVQAEIQERYPQNAPRDFDPGYAGERWDEDY